MGTPQIPRIIFETERLRLRELNDDDIPGIREMLADEMAQQIFRQVVAQPDYAERWVARNRERYREHGFGLWALEERSTGEFLGDCGLTPKELGGRRFLEVGYHLTLAARGRGYATEAAVACLRYAFNELGATLVGSIVDVENHASQKVAERIHARREEGFEYFGSPAYLYLTEPSDL